ncbi:MAG: type II secretion system protein GspG, partial [Planctomycetes bacterium]|nr:type II secretion system protein GspG [Planctomycetota bacterium]
MKINKRQKRRANAGFSLAELMVVILIIGLLSTLVIPKVMDSFGDAKWGKVRGDLSTIGSVLETFSGKNGGSYPDSLERLVEPDQNGKRYLSQTIVPKDPWDHEYVYNPPEGTSDFELVCYGKDGVPGGEGDDR